MTTLKPIATVAQELGIAAEHVIPWGRSRAKIAAEALAQGPGKGRLVLVTAINPTPAGEGKTTMSIALAMGLARRGRRSIAALRQPSLGPVFGIKGGGTGGGLSTIEPSVDINLNRNSDLHPVADAHNLLAALVDNAIHFKSPVEIDPLSVRWRRVLDVNDRALRDIVLGLGGKANGTPRESAVDITAASEVMAILCLSSSLEDLQTRLGRIVVARTPKGEPVRASDLRAHGAMTALLRDAMLPNLVQTREGGAAFIHGGPFGNIAHGCSSIAATRLALAYGDEVITEAGFGLDLGGEKFLNIKCRTAGLWPRATVLVATLRALRHHGGADAKSVNKPDRDALMRGFDHLGKHLESLQTFGVPAVVVVNRFADDPESEIAELRSFAKTAGVELALCDAFARGGEGALDLADRVLDVLDRTDTTPAQPKFTYALDAPIEAKISAVALQVYGARDVAFTPRARDDLKQIEALGGAGLPVCMAKTHLSLTDDPTKRGRPREFTITVREARLSAGAGFVVALTGEIMTMPGLPREPSAWKISVSPDGTINGVS